MLNTNPIYNNKNIMLFKKTYITLIALSLSLPLCSFVNAADHKMMVVETRKIIESSLAHQDILANVQKKNETYRDEVQLLEADLKKQYQDLETQKNALSQDAIDKKNEAMSKEVAELQKKSYSQHTALEDAYRTATQVLIDKTSEIVKQQAKKNGYSIVIEKGVAVYSDDALDITNSVLDELNKVLPKVAVEFKSDEVTTTKSEIKTDNTKKK